MGSTRAAVSSRYTAASRAAAAKIVLPRAEKTRSMRPIAKQSPTNARAKRPEPSSRSTSRVRAASPTESRWSAARIPTTAPEAAPAAKSR
eukprot:CAMPEP_0171501896 /NCGR_PEP_ID=MMETSP0958-20121227/9831_1 /TAXON_ID=87120 /ORGANISM="Aurantiochytrium limacinum, Strain ATCCMYA-1381" /LENGTH=89 /DNA_ID=CAMNT_0012036799 /DNA_START=522 /DNA_END=788 /DNA_ORIENTATION=-